MVDLGCGGGIWARALADAGYGVLGIDRSSHMLAIARRRVPEGRFVRASFLDAALPACSAVTAIGEVFSYGQDPRSAHGGLAALFRRIHEALLPGGVLIFDVAAPGRGGPGRAPRRTYHEAADWTLCLEVVEDAEQRMLTRRIIVFREEDGAYRRSREVHRLGLYEPGEVVRELAEAGFEARILRGYGPRRFGRGHMGFTASRGSRAVPA
ncbi:MAG: hypothetical protein QOK40_73 [Miltoncostaeaceae bacterium]|nr:hypothetical protein [Miltoncostaeaceae bacterium]